MAADAQPRFLIAFLLALGMFAAVSYSAFAQGIVSGAGGAAGQAAAGASSAAASAARPAADRARATAAQAAGAAQTSPPPVATNARPSVANPAGTRQTAPAGGQMATSQQPQPVQEVASAPVNPVAPEAVSPGRPEVQTSVAPPAPVSVAAPPVESPTVEPPLPLTAAEPEAVHVPAAPAPARMPVRNSLPSPAEIVAVEPTQLTVPSSDSAGVVEELLPTPTVESVGSDLSGLVGAPTEVVTTTVSQVADVTNRVAAATVGSAIEPSAPSPNISQAAPAGLLATPAVPAEAVDQMLAEGIISVLSDSAGADAIVLAEDMAPAATDSEVVLIDVEPWPLAGTAGLALASVPSALAGPTSLISDANSGVELQQDLVLSVAAGRLVFDGLQSAQGTDSPARPAAPSPYGMGRGVLTGFGGAGASNLLFIPVLILTIALMAVPRLIPLFSLKLPPSAVHAIPVPPG
jgi:hypothetical protein